MNHYVYKLTEKHTNEFYYGVRSCECEPINDYYMGSMIVWHPNTDNLIKTIIAEFDSREDAIIFETLMITTHIKHPLNKNYHTGAGLAFYGHSHSEKTKKKVSESMKNKHLGERNPFFGKKHSIDTLEKIRNSMLGKTHSDDTKQKMSNSAKNIDKSKFNLNHKKIQYIPTGEVFHSIYDASKKLKTSRNTIKRHIKNKITNSKFKLI